MSTSEPFTVLSGGPPAHERETRLAEGADELATDGSHSSIFRRDHFLLSVAGALMAVGIIIIVIGWAGAAHATLVEEQLPYVISGGLLGVALAVIGALTLFTHWLTVLIREGRAQEATRRRDHAELIATLQTVTTALAAQEDIPNGSAGSKRANRPVRRTPRG